MKNIGAELSLVIGSIALLGAVSNADGEENDDESESSGLTHVSVESGRR